MHTYIHLVFFQLLRLVLGAIGSVLEATGLPRTDPIASCVVPINLYPNPIFSCVLIHLLYILLDPGSGAKCLATMRKKQASA